MTDETGNQYVYDAWNHLVQVKDAEGNILRSYTYDGLGRRITETTGSGESAIITTLYYNTNWQVVEAPCFLVVEEPARTRCFLYIKSSSIVTASLFLLITLLIKNV